MNRLSVSAAYYSAGFTLKRPDLNWAKIKENLGIRLHEFNEWAKKQMEFNPNTKVRPLAVSMEATALRILWVYVQKFKVGQIRNYTVKFCRNYLANAVGAGFKAPHVVTMDRHIDKFLSMPKSFIKSQERSTLGLPGQDTNCIALQIDPSLLVFSDPKHQENHEKGIELMNLPKPRHQKKSYRREQQMITPTTPLRNAQTEEQKAVVQAVKTSATSLGNLMGDFFNQFSESQSTPS
ncbi:hypothetical protein VB796_06720 [Arcicella sp. LKC2W]|uniref:hypothetical protein n=1 Tax=Arcicella sp. LKC2W TaxID=2984198 RepID=UPI002B1FE1E9|nr:hypothetical protein [Arcicella sp. LKC2W]MEA5458721.1 hypothetical protein [Arcicella sp. LKC2W]